MQIINFKLPSDDCNLFLFGDVHTGSLMSHEDGFKDLVNAMNSSYDGLDPKYNFGIDHGDMIEAIEVRDKRFCLETTKTASIDKQIEQAIEMRLPIKDKLICCLKGNHEHAIIRFTNAAQRICEGVGVRYGTYTSIINYTDQKGQLMFKHFATHGSGSIRSDADDPVRQLSNRRLSLKRKLKNKFGDCLLNSLGHTHQLIVLKPEPILYLTSNGDKVGQNYTSPKKRIGYIEPNHKWFVNTGSFVKLYLNGVDGYAERALYDPVELGYVICKVRNRTVSELVKVTL